MVLKVSLNTGINRIRLEFKDDRTGCIGISENVLIESDWNLKKRVRSADSTSLTVLIESDWNLKP